MPGHAAIERDTTGLVLAVDATGAACLDLDAAFDAPVPCDWRLPPYGVSVPSSE